MRDVRLCQVVVMGAVMACAAQAHAKQKVASEAQESQAAAQEAAALERRRRIAAETRSQLAGTAWTLEFKPYRSTDASTAPFTDELTFEDGKVSSKRFGNAGYAPSAYSVNVQGATPLWETMQVKEGEGTMTWSGELYGEAMGGILTKRPSDPEKQAEHFQFTGALISQAKPAPEEPLQPPAATATISPTAPSATEEQLPQPAPESDSEEASPPSAAVAPQDPHLRGGFPQAGHPSERNLT